VTANPLTMSCMHWPGMGLVFDFESAADLVGPWLLARYSSASSSSARIFILA
jgi:hypothetical protein